MILFKLIFIFFIMLVKNDTSQQQSYSPLPKFPFKSNSITREKWKEILLMSQLMYKRFEEEARRRYLQRKIDLDKQKKERIYKENLNRILSEQRQNDKSIFNDFYSGRY